VALVASLRPEFQEAHMPEFNSLKLRTSLGPADQAHGNPGRASSLAESLWRSLLGTG
jgi:hypothetical protein